MARAGAELSVADLERMLDRKRSRLNSLEKRREQLQKSLSRIDQQISALQGRPTVAAVRRKTRKRPKNPRPLAAYVLQFLGRSKKGLTLAELAQKIQDAGYKSNAEDFKNVVYQCIYKLKNVVHDVDTETYRLHSAQPD